MSQRKRWLSNNVDMGHQKRIGVQEGWDCKFTDYYLRWIKRWRRSAIYKHGKIQRIKAPWKIH